MTVQLKGQGGSATAVAPISLPQRHARMGSRAVLMIASLLVGILAGWLGYLIVSGIQDASRSARVEEIQHARAQALVRAYEATWEQQRPTHSIVAVTGTGPGLTWVAAQQTTPNVITGTGPGLVIVAEAQGRSQLSQAPTGTGPGLELLADMQGAEEASVATP